MSNNQYNTNMRSNRNNRGMQSTSNTGNNWNSGHHRPTQPVHAHIAPNAHTYRSAAESRVDHSSKFRQLPCKTLISTGSCPYGERCVFLHDTRLLCQTSHSISRMKNKEDNVADSFFWPVTVSSSAAPARKTDHNFLPYNVPSPAQDQYQLHDQALYSLWMHYVEFCRVTTKSQKSGVPLKVQDVPVNTLIHRPRLPVFQLLSSSNGRDIAPQQFALARLPDSRVVTHSSPVWSPQQQPMSYQSPPRSLSLPAALSPDSVTHSGGGLMFLEHGARSREQLKAVAAQQAIVQRYEKQQQQQQQQQQQGLVFLEHYCGGEKCGDSHHSRLTDSSGHSSCDLSPQRHCEVADSDDSVSVLSEDSGFACLM